VIRALCAIPPDFIAFPAFQAIPRRPSGCQQILHPARDLKRRGKELHAPDVTLLNANNILIVESVGPDSQVAKRIEELKKK